FNIYAKHENKPKNLFALKVKMPEMAADSFFTALPGGMFRTFKGIKTSGTLSYQLTFEIDKDNPDSLVFDSSLKKKNFRINKFGAENYTIIDTSFVFEAMDGDRLVRRITVGPQNPVFTSLDQISPYLKYAVMTSEDGSFMYHRGFNEDAFRESIITNYKAKRFLRGGSTITMQLVKNCFLSRDKTVSRKAEEALIVWLIENNGLVSKDRMLEVYLNVIEWGPDVYGVGEASGFYFGKQPKDLNLPECIYLASIIPHPKYFKYSFDSTGTLKPFLAGYFRLVSSKMVGRNWITPADTAGLQPSVKLIGPAKNFVLPIDTFSVPIDSIIKEDIEIR
ncbi:MAG: biosynthetic peptidoglycan transglycosylase, partial [Bacteroidia bacterium]